MFSTRLRNRAQNSSPILIILLSILCANPAYPQSEAVKILVIGDSLSAGYGLPQENGLLPQLETWLLENGAEVEFMNGAISGDTTTAGLERFEWTRGAPHDALIIELGANDMLRGIAPEIVENNLKQMLERAENTPTMLWGIHANPSYTPEYVEAFDEIYPKLGAEFETPVIKDILEPIRALDGASRINFMQNDGIHPNAEGVKLLVETIGPEVLAFYEAMITERLQTDNPQ